MSRFEIQTRQPDGPWVSVSYYIFRSWTGNRRLDGVAYNGPVVILGEGLPNPATNKDVDEAEKKELA